MTTQRITRDVVLGRCGLTLTTPFQLKVTSNHPIPLSENASRVSSGGANAGREGCPLGRVLNVLTRLDGCFATIR